jgi:hypothetical protein
VAFKEFNVMKNMSSDIVSLNKARERESIPHLLTAHKPGTE